MRDYGVEGQYGLESSPAEYVETMRALFAQVRRVLADDGTLWLNIGDSYSVGAAARHNTNQPNKNRDGSNDSTFATFGAHFSPGRESHGVPAKNLMGIPWRTAFALQDDGWILRNDIIWAKPNGMPESVTDRLSTKHEHLFMFSKRARYWFDLDPIREAMVDAADAPNLSWARESKEAVMPGRSGESAAQHRAGRTHGKASSTNLAPTGSQHRTVDAKGGRNPGDVWSIATQPFAAAHFAVMPQALASRAIQAGCKPGGTVLDPFSGSGTTGLAAARHGRGYVGIDLNAEYLDLSLRTRLAQSAIDFGEATA